MTLELFPYWIGDHGFLNVFHQSQRNFTASHFWIEGTSQMIEWVVNCWCSAGDLGKSQQQNFKLMANELPVQCYWDIASIVVELF